MCKKRLTISGKPVESRRRPFSSSLKKRAQQIKTPVVHISRDNGASILLERSAISSRTIHDISGFYAAISYLFPGAEGFFENIRIAHIIGEILTNLPPHDLSFSGISRDTSAMHVTGGCTVKIHNKCGRLPSHSSIFQGIPTRIFRVQRLRNQLSTDFNHYFPVSIHYRHYDRLQKSRRPQNDGLPLSIAHLLAECCE